jgi:hypothetical protein
MTSIEITTGINVADTGDGGGIHKYTIAINSCHCRCD